MNRNRLDVAMEPLHGYGLVSALQSFQSGSAPIDPCIPSLARKAPSTSGDPEVIREVQPESSTESPGGRAACPGPMDGRQGRSTLAGELPGAARFSPSR